VFISLAFPVNSFRLQKLLYKTIPAKKYF
jgi:hypothetical protein